MNSDSSPTRSAFPLSENKIIKKTISGSIGALFSVFILAIIIIPPVVKNLAGPLSTLILVGLVVLLLISILYNYIYQIYYFKFYYYDLTDNFTVIRKGVWGKKEITTAYSKVQDVYMDQDIFDRIFSLYDVHLSTATMTSGMEAHIDGLGKAAAEGLKNALLTKVQAHSVKING